MGKGAKKDLFQNSGYAQDLSREYGNNAQQLYGSLAPQLEAESVSPSGYAPSDMAAMRTAAMQSAGGTQAGATGAGRLYAQRTRNSGGIGDAIASSARSAGEQLGKESVGIQAANAQLKQKQRQAGLSGLEGLTSTEMGAGLNALGLSNQALKDENEGGSFWQKLLLQGIQSGGQVAAAYEGNK